MFQKTNKSLAPARLAVTIAIVAWFMDTAANGAPASGAPESRMKVLVVGSSDKVHALEEAASLSLDLPVHEPTKEQELDRQRTNQTSSLGYHKTSLASLTLHQQDSPLTGEGRNAGRNISRHPDPWPEIHLQRFRPTWLNVSSRFKITGSSIEEMADFVPPEYSLRAAFDSPILLKTRLGIMEGVRSIRFNKHLYTFLSVPYARAPIGDLRFKGPVPVDKWDGIYQATKWPPFCVQPSMTLASKSSPVHILSHIMSEDCLYLNIWTPSLKLNKGRMRPVMVWIHGGAFQYGGISVDENDGSALALLGDVVVVTLNYRISAFGFLNANNPKNAPNNVGIQDQRAAMEWVQANIRQFGGDPQQVTLFGESAGGHSVGLHMISPASQPLFRRAILQSGVPVSFLRSYDVNADNKNMAHTEGVSSLMMAKRLGCLDSLNQHETTTEPPTNIHSENEAAASTDSSDETNANESEEENGPILDDRTVECMRSKSSLEILKAMGKPGSSGFFPTGNDPKGVFPNGPIMESFDPEEPKIGPQKDYLIGINSGEGAFMLHYGLPSVFPARSPPKVVSVDQLKSALEVEISRLGKNPILSMNSSDIQSASGNHNGGAQAHLYRPLLRTSTSMLESFMEKSQSYASYANLTREEEFGKKIASLVTDIIFLCPARSLAKTLTESGRNVYFYLYTHRSSLSQYHKWFGVTHHDEVEFVFGRPLRLADVYSGRDIEMSQRMIKTWSHFAYTGQMLDQLGVKWPKYDQEDNSYMTLNSENALTGQRYHDVVCNIYDTVISVHLQEG